MAFIGANNFNQQHPNINATNNFVDIISLREVDNFLYAAGKAASLLSNNTQQKQKHKIGIISTKFCVNISNNQLCNYYIYKVENPSIILFPVPSMLNNKPHLILTAFNLLERKVAYFDSLKNCLLCDSYYIIKQHVAREFKIQQFDEIPQNQIYNTINDNPLPQFCNFHVCRIAEEIIFNGINRKLNPFNIEAEVERIKNICRMFSQPSWSGNWPPTLQDVNFNLIFNSVVNNSGEVNNLNPTLGNSVNGNVRAQNSIGVNGNPTNGNPTSPTNTQASNESITPAATAPTPPTLLNNIINNNINISLVVADLQKISTEPINNDNNIECEKSSEIAVNYKILQIPTAIMEQYKEMCPLLSTLLCKYLNFNNARHDHYNRNETRCNIQTSKFNWNVYKQMNHKDNIEARKMLEDFPYFCELPEPEKLRLFKRFWKTYSIIERIVDTLDNLDPENLNNENENNSNNLIMLQNCQVFDVEELLLEDLSEFTFDCARVAKIIYNSWNKLLPLMKEINPNPMEIMYIFCCILWNTFYLENPLCKESEECIRRGRFIIHMEMRRHYKYDNIKTQKLFALKDIIQFTESTIQEYSKVV